MKRILLPSLILPTLLSVMLLSGCGRIFGVNIVLPGAAPKVGEAPTNGWPVSTPAEQGMDAAQLDALQAAVHDRAIPLRSLLVIRHGAIVSEAYFAGADADTDQELYSVTKSFTSTLVGIALDQGKIESVDQRVADLLPGRTFANPDPRKEAMTLKDLLTMTSGLDWVEGDPAYRSMYTTGDWVGAVMDRAMREAPGERFNYCSGCTHILSAILQEQTGMSTSEFAEKYLFQPLGLRNVRWDTDAQGIAVGGWGIYLTPREMARLGYLYLYEGSWDGQQIVSADYVKAATTGYMRDSERLSYGYQWWIYNDSDAYAALGRYGQTIYVSPEHDLIVVTTAKLDGNHDPILDLIDEFVLPAVVE